MHPCIYSDDNVSVYIEMLDGDKAFLHCTVTNWSPSLYRQFRQIFKDLTIAFKKKGYKVIFAPDMDNKTTKFAKMFGFKETQHKIVGEDFKVRGVLECHLQ